MNKLIRNILALALCASFAQCEDYLNTSSPANADDSFVTSTPSETFKTLSWAYACYRQDCVMGIYNWNDPVSSDVEYYPEGNSSNNSNAKLKPEIMTVDAVAGGFNSLYTVIARASKVATIVAEKGEYQADVAAGKTSEWTQLYGEAMGLRALCYFDLIKHFGDVPYNYENSYVDNYTLNSRFMIYDELIATLKEVEPYMYKIGEGSLTAERISRTFVNALIGEIALFAGGYQTIRTDVEGLYGDVQFERKGKEANGCVYARRTDYLNYYRIAEQYLQGAVNNAGTARLVTVDDREYADNPFQRHFQYGLDLKVSPESLFEVGCAQGPSSTGMAMNGEYGYAFGRPSNGGNQTAPNKTFSAVRVLPTFYYGGYANDDKRRDVSATVTGSTGKGNEVLLTFKPGAKTDGGISINKWDLNRQNPPYTGKQRMAGINWPIMRMADVILMLAETKAELGADAEATSLLNQIRERAFGDAEHNISLTGEALKEAILMERKFELVGEGMCRWDLIRSGKYSESAIAVRNATKEMISDLKTKGYHRFANGNEIPAYVWTKQVKMDQPLTYDCMDVNDPVLFPGWRGQYDWSNTDISGIQGTDHNTAIVGLFEYIDPESDEAKALEADGYKKTAWAFDLIANESVFMDNILSGITSADEAPRYYWPIPYETVNQSKGQVTNGYGLPQQ